MNIPPSGRPYHRPRLGWRLQILGLLLQGSTVVAAQSPTRPLPPPPAAAEARGQIEVLFVSPRRCVLSAEVASRIVSMPEREGDSFTRGQVLVTLEEAVYAANVAKAEARAQAAREDLALLENRQEAEANVAKAEARLRSAGVHRRTQEGLFKDKAVSVSELEDARAAERIAQADLAIARARLASRKREVAKARAMVAMAEADLLVARKQLADCRIKAPFAGRVVRLLARPHERVQPGQQLLEILDESVLEARFFLPVELLERVRIGDEVSITLHGSNATVRARIARVGAEVNSVTSTITVYAEYRNRARTGGKVRSGMRGTLRLDQFRPRGNGAPRAPAATGKRTP